VEIEAAVTVLLGLYFCTETVLLLLYSLRNDLIEAVKCTAYNEEDIGRIDLDALFVRMLSSALRWNISYSALKNLKECLLDAFTAYVTCDRDILGLLSDLIDLVDIYDACLGTLDVIISCNNKLQEDILNVFTDVSCLCKACSICNSERYIKDPCKGLCKKCLTRACRA
jgi:hypothetical protein